MERFRSKWNSNLKHLSLLLIVVQATVAVILMRWSKVSGANTYFSSSAVVAAEFLKMVICVGLIYQESSDRFYSVILSHLLEPRHFLPILIPSSLYAIQNNLLFYGLTHLQVPHYQILYQLKVFTTAIFSSYLLGVVFSLRQRISLVALFIGVVMIQIDTVQEEPKNLVDRPWYSLDTVAGSISVLTATMTSAFSGVYFEKILKGSPVSLWVRNLQLAVFGFIVSIFITYTKDITGIWELGFFHGWNLLVVVIVFVNALGGLVVGVAVKHADNVLKGFAVSISVVLSSILSYFLFDFQFHALFMVGGLLVLASAGVYQLPPHVSLPFFSHNTPANIV